MCFRLRAGACEICVGLETYRDTGQARNGLTVLASVDGQRGLQVFVGAPELILIGAARGGARIAKKGAPEFRDVGEAEKSVLLEGSPDRCVQRRRHAGNDRSEVRGLGIQNNLHDEKHGPAIE